MSDPISRLPRPSELDDQFLVRVDEVQGMLDRMSPDDPGYHEIKGHFERTILGLQEAKKEGERLKRGYRTRSEPFRWKNVLKLLAVAFIAVIAITYFR